MIGFRIGIPLSPRRLDKSNWKFSGSELYSFELQASLDKGEVNNAIGRRLPRYYTLDRVFFNNGRTGDEHWNHQLGRMQNAYTTFGTAPANTGETVELATDKSP